MVLRVGGEKELSGLGVCAVGVVRGYRRKTAANRNFTEACAALIKVVGFLRASLKMGGCKIKKIPKFGNTTRWG